MVKHIVMWKFKESAEGKTKQENMEIVRDSLYALVDKIDKIKKLEVQFDITHSDMSMDLVLITEFNTVEDMKAYAVDPRHLEVSAYVRRVIENRVLIDYNF